MAQNGRKGGMKQQNDAVERENKSSAATTSLGRTKRAQSSWNTFCLPKVPRGVFRQRRQASRAVWGPPQDVVQPPYQAPPAALRSVPHFRTLHAALAMVVVGDLAKHALKLGLRLHVHPQLHLQQ